MTINRRDFLVSAAAGILAPKTVLQRQGTRKHWTWLRGEVKDTDRWRRMLASLKAAGFDAVLISGSPDFYRTHVPLARAEGLELHAWMFTMMRGEHAATRPEWYVVSGRGESAAEKPAYVEYYRFMCPSRPEVRAYLRDVVAGIASVEGLGSVHLDYIRYPDVILPVALWPKYKIVQDREYPQYDYCYCEVCRSAFRQQSGLDPAKIADPSSNGAWRQYRYDTITAVVGELHDVAHTHGKSMTAAVFPTPTIARTLVRQDWTRWKIDALMPMVYNGFYNEGVPWVERATREGVEALGGRIPLYTGLYVPDLPPADLADAVRRALAGGAAGVSVFQGDMLTPDYLKALQPVLRGA